MTFALMVTRASGMYITYGFGLLTLDQTYKCVVNGEQQSCSTTYICAHPETVYSVDTSNPDYVSNWQQQMGLQCTDRSTIQMILMPTFLFAGIAGLTLNQLPDRWGCQKTFKMFLTIHLLAQSCIIFSHSYWVRLFSLAVIGICYLKNSCCYMYIGGVIRVKDSSICSGFINSFDTATVFIMGAYFKFVSRDWFPLLVT